MIGALEVLNKISVINLLISQIKASNHIFLIELI